MHCKELCEPHYRQQLMGKTLNPIVPQRPKGTGLIRNESGQKKCLGCVRWLDESSFTVDQTTVDNLKVRCKLCKVIQLNNIDYDQYMVIFDRQNGRCAVCQKENEKSLAIDHNHKCCSSRYSCGKCIRGLLCSSCNLAEGLLYSSAVVIANMLEYVKNGGFK